MLGPCWRLPRTAAALLAAAGDNPDRLATEASFAVLCGVSPVDASSGRQHRHRLNRGGDRDANRALCVIVLVRMATDPRTREHVTRRTGQSLSSLDIERSCSSACASSTTPRPLTEMTCKTCAQPVVATSLLILGI